MNFIKSKAIPNPETTIPTDNLLPETIEYLKSNGSNSTKVTEIISNNDPVVNKLIEEGSYKNWKNMYKWFTIIKKFKIIGIKKVNEKSTSNASKIQKFLILPKDFSVLTGELGPTLKLRRQIVNKMYENEIKKLYSDK